MRKPVPMTLPVSYPSPTLAEQVHRRSVVAAYRTDEEWCR